MPEEILRMECISKHFGGVKALKKVSFSCYKGEVHALAGENGAGKSTILKILAGVYQPDEGRIIYKGDEVVFKTPGQAQHNGIAMVFQELTLIGELSVAENIFLNNEPRTRYGTVDKKLLRSNVRKIMDRYKISIDIDSMVKRLSVAQQQMTEILKILVRNPDVIILDEPTSALARQEVDKLYEIIHTMKDEGKTIIFISHRLEEIFTITDRVTVFKDGEFIGTRNTKEINSDDLVKMMVGRELKSIFPPFNDKSDEVVFEASHLCGHKVKDISFKVFRGEVLGIAGLEGHGQTELLNLIAGILSRTSGDILLEGSMIKAHTPWAAIKEGIALVPADRKTQGLSLSLSITNNLVMSSLHKRQMAGFVRRTIENRFVSDIVQRLNIKISSPKVEVQSLSGGNQQKVVLGKELAIGPKVILFNEPTRGIDVESKSEFYRIMRDLASKGVTVIMCSGDLMEIVGMSDRIIVLYEGALSGELSRENISEENVMRYAVGLKVEG
ncbi:MAG: sugar ABC transporter ATP-binding protein [Saccharofermentanales bacterium]